MGRIEKLERLIEIEEAIQHFETRINEAEWSNVFGLGSQFLSIKEKNEHNIIIYGMCIGRINERFTKQIDKLKQIMNKNKTKNSYWLLIESEDPFKKINKIKVFIDIDGDIISDESICKSSSQVNSLEENDSFWVTNLKDLSAEFIKSFSFKKIKQNKDEQNIINSALISRVR